MSKNTKIILGIVAGLVVLCGIACVVLALSFGLIGRQVAKQVSSGVSEDPQKVQAAAQQIADFDLPAGFTPQTSLDLLGFKMVAYTASSEKNYLILMQMPTTMEINETTIQQFEQQMEKQSGRQINNLHTVDSRQLTIRGKPAQEITQEGSDDSGATIRQMMVIFEGKGGNTAMLVAGGPADQFKQSDFDTMVQSIK